jgi:aminopeptidase N
MPRLSVLFFLLIAAPLAAQPEDPRASDPTASGGPLLLEQAAYRVHHYDIDLAVDPAERHIEGRSTVHAEVVLPARTLVLDLDTTFAVAGISEARYGEVPFERHGGRLWLDFGRTLQPGEPLEVAVVYAGHPRVAPNPPWGGGFTWVDRPDGTHWAAVSLQGEGADLWLPVKDHPSDRPDSVRAAFTVPAGHDAMSNGRLEGITEGEGTRTFRWFTSTPINNYNITLYVGPFEELAYDYTSTTGEAIPFTFHALPEAVADARRQLPQFADHMRFMEETFGPYPFRRDKYAVIHAPYLGMEHQTAIAYGDRFQNNAFGFDWLHLHELAHEWFGNLITVPDWSHFWVHEGFAMYVEALYAERIGGMDAYHRYMRQRMRGVIANRRPVVPAPGGDAQEVYFGRTDATDQDVYFKGGWFIHTLRGLFRAELGEEAGERAFFHALRRLTYPDPALEADLGCAACRFVTTEDVRRTFEEALGSDLGDVFRLYLSQPVLPVLEESREGDRLALRWRTPEGYPFALPVEVEVDGRRQVVLMTGGRGTLEVPSGARVSVDPQGWILRHEG